MGFFYEGGKKRTELQEGSKIRKESTFITVELLCIYSRKVVSILYHLLFVAWAVVVHMCTLLAFYKVLAFQLKLLILKKVLLLFLSSDSLSSWS